MAAVNLTKRNFRMILLAPALAAAGMLPLLGGCGSQPPATATVATHVSAGQICGEDIDRTGTELIKNGGFVNGMADWQHVDVPGSQGTDLAQLVNDPSCGTSVLALTRQGSGNVSGLIGLEQAVNVNKGSFSTLQVQLVARIDQQAMTSDGVLGGESPVFITLDYTTTAGQVKSWTHGLVIGKVNYPDRDQAIPAAYWFTYKSGNLLTMLPGLATVQKVTIGGNGNDFASRAALVSLLGR